jgi:FkbM family methyltransferase
MYHRDMTTSNLIDVLHPSRLPAIVDVGASPVDGYPPYHHMLTRQLCSVAGFEPHKAAYEALCELAGPNERYYPYALGDGEEHTLHLAQSMGMTSLLEPDPERLALFEGFSEWGRIARTETVQTYCLDAVVDHMDLLKIDVQGSELMVFKGAKRLLADALFVHTEVSFVPLYHGQPMFADVDNELRRYRLIPHKFESIKSWPLVAGGKSEQLLEADVVYVRDPISWVFLSDEQLKHLALIARHVYDSEGLVALTLRELASRGVLVGEFV